MGRIIESSKNARFEKDILSWLNSEDLDKTAEYISRGRRFEANFSRLDPGRPEIAILTDAMLRAPPSRNSAHQSAGRRAQSQVPQEAATEHWWADVLADPCARIRRQPGGLYGRDSKR